MPALLEIKNLAVQFNTIDGIVHAVNGVSFSIEEGQTLGIVGESGCGKSVSLLSVLRLIQCPPGKINSGEILYHGEDLLKKSLPDMEHIRGKEIAMIFQDPMTSFNPVYPIGFQISESLENHLKLSKAEARRRAIELLEMVGIPEAGERSKDYPHQYSGGMRQRSMIAMALACSPTILIADEPTTALDVTIQAQILDLVNRLRDQIKMSMIWITHDLGVVAGLAQRVIVMYAGFIVEEARVADLYSDPRHPYTLGLLGSLPRIDRARPDQRLVPIAGSPPDLLHLPPGCPFLPRCRYAAALCSRENPSLRTVGRGHHIACWVDVTQLSTVEAAT
jgi:oligopeptide transport system ATP-binding protein